MLCCGDERSYVASLIRNSLQNLRTIYCLNVTAFGNNFTKEQQTKEGKKQREKSTANLDKDPQRNLIKRNEFLCLKLFRNLAVGKLKMKNERGRQNKATAARCRNCARIIFCSLHISSCYCWFQNGNLCCRARFWWEPMTLRKRYEHRESQVDSKVGVAIAYL